MKIVLEGTVDSLKTREDKHYNNVHHWILRKYGNANKCEIGNCKYENPKRYEWALIKGKSYNKNIENYMQLCPSCHRKYDVTREMIKGILNENIKRRIKIIQMTKEGEEIKKWDSITEAALFLGIGKSAIAKCVRGDKHFNTCKGFIWKPIK